MDASVEVDSLFQWCERLDRDMKPRQHRSGATNEGFELEVLPEATHVGIVEVSFGLPSYSNSKDLVVGNQLALTGSAVADYSIPFSSQKRILELD